MEKASPIAIVLCLSLALACFGCAGRPEEQLQQAQKALDLAKEEHAEEFAPAEWKNAQEAWDQAQTALTQGQYSSAYTTLVRAKSRLERAHTIAKGRRDIVRQEVEQMQAMLQERYTTLKTDVAASKRISGPIRKKLEASYEGINQVIEKLRSQINQGDYTPAKKTAESASQQVYDAEMLFRVR